MTPEQIRQEILRLTRAYAQAVHAGHGDIVVGDDQEAGLSRAGHFIEQIAEALHIGVVQRRVHFVQQAEGAGLGEEDAEEEREGDERALAG